MSNANPTPATVRNAAATRKPSPAAVAAAEMEKLRAELAETKAALEAAKTEAASAKKAVVASGYKGYADKEISPVAKRFVSWIAAEYPELYPSVDKIDERLVFVAIKAYAHFQRSAANRDVNGKPLGRKAA
jgi:hypothetical protein